MQRITCLATVLALVSSLAAGRADTVAYWRFENGDFDSAATGDGTILDSSGHNLNGSPVNGPIYRADVAANPIPRTGAANTVSMDFNGGQRVFIPDDPAFELTDSLTLEAFVNVRNGADGKIVFRGDDRGGLDPYQLVVYQDNFYFVITSETDIVLLNTPIPSFDHWYHVAGTLDGASGEVKLYVDGALATSQTTSVRPIAQLDPAWTPGLGIANVQSGNYSQYFVGLVDEVRISDVALAPNEFLIPEPSSLALGALGTLGYAVASRTSLRCARRPSHG